MTNPIAAGLARHNGNTRAFYEALKERAKREGMTAMEWDWYRARQKEWEPDVQAREMEEATRRIAMDAARKLPTEDLMLILAERHAK
jgi:hypothetical protein